jgi:hypothetical protein
MTMEMKLATAKEKEKLDLWLLIVAKERKMVV